MRINDLAMNTLEQFTDLLFPRSCSGCENILLANEKLICTHCRLALPKTNWHHYKENPVAEIFKGRCDVALATAFMHFRKGSLVQQFLHNLKYRGQQELGVKLGHLMGIDLARSEAWKSVEAIIPIPLHKKKLAIRGYNQSELLAIGIGKAGNWELNITSLSRQKFTESQTTKDRLARQLNLKSAFYCEPFAYRHVLLVDDVITTGATIESAVESIRKENPQSQVSVVSLAMAE